MLGDHSAATRSNDRLTNTTRKSGSRTSNAVVLHVIALDCEGLQQVLYQVLNSLGIKGNTSMRVTRLHSQQPAEQSSNYVALEVER
jgi:hypothetical protein